MKKYFFLVIIAILGVSFYLNASQEVMQPLDQPLDVAFKASEATFFELKFQGWAEINNKYSTVEELNAYADMVEAALGVQSSGERAIISEESFKSLKMSCAIQEGVVSDITFQSLEGEQCETYLIINILSKNDPDNSLVWRQQILTAFQEFDKTPEINTLYVGFIAGEIKNSKCNKIIKDIFKAVGGKIVEGVDEPNYISKTGFVPNLLESVKVADKEVNMQVGASYNDLDERTYLFIGAPLIMENY